MRKVNGGKKTGEKKKKIMFIVATNVVASQTSIARAKIVLVVPLLPPVTSMLSKAQLCSAC